MPQRSLWIYVIKLKIIINAIKIKKYLGLPGVVHISKLTLTINTNRNRDLLSYLYVKAGHFPIFILRMSQFSTDFCISF